MEYPMVSPVSRSLVFPDNFVWGVAAAAPQIEGGADADARGASVWDHYSRQPGKILNGDTPAVACDHYHRFGEDFALMRELGVKNYRLSLAWPRILPDGDGAVNTRGIDFYHRLFDAMQENGITPWVTMFHWDLPQALEDRFGGWRSRKVVDAFARYADTVVKAYGDRVKHWFTLNEIIAFTRNGYGIARNAPGLSEPDAVVNQTYHHALLCHGHGVRAVREHGAAGSVVGLVDNPRIPMPLNADNPADLAAAREVFIADNIRVLDPLFRGRYTEDYERMIPAADRAQVEPGDFDLITSPTDFLGLNVYAGFFVRGGAGGHAERVTFPVSYPTTGSDWHQITPQSIYWAPRLLTEIYGRMPLYIAENGCGFLDDRPDASGEVIDLHRRQVLRDYLAQMHRAIEEDIPLKGYFLWSFMDNFEWGVGYSVRFGVVHVDYGTQRRTPKLSARWYAEVMRANSID